MHNKVFLLISVGLLLGAANGVSADVVVQYSFEDNVLDTASGGTVADDLTVQLSSGATGPSYVDGILGRAVEVVPPSVPGAISFFTDDSPDIDLPVTYTMEAFIKPAALGGTGSEWGHILVRWGASNPEYGFSFGLRGDILYAFHNQAGGVYNPVSVSGGSPQVGQWSHVALTSAADGSLKLYQDGELVGSATHNGTFASVDVILSVIGPGGYQQFTGVIDEVLLWDEVKDEAYMQSRAMLILPDHGLDPISPEHGSEVVAGPVTLSWNNLDPNYPEPVTVDVYFGEDPGEDPEDPNKLIASKVVSNGNVNSVGVTAVADTMYYWKVNSYNTVRGDYVEGPWFIFFAVSNLPPEVDAGENDFMWLDPTTAVYNLDGTVTDDGQIQPYTVTWSLVSGPNSVSFGDSNAEDTTVTFSFAGDYQLNLEAFDGELATNDTVTISVYADACEAAQTVQPDYQPFPGDIDEDCYVDLIDLALLVDDWLDYNGL